MKLAKRLDLLPPYLFVEISRKIAEKRAQGERVVSFAIGDPDIPTPPHIIDRLCQAAQVPANHRYPETDGLPQLRQAIARWYQERFGAKLDPDKEVLPLIGSKEGIAHAALCFIDPGDVALVPDPSYPPFRMGTLLAGGQPHYMPLTAENDFLPDLEAVPPQVARQAKVLWLNYPNNPTAAVAGLDFFEKAVAFAREHDMVLCHDAPYTEVAFDGYRPVSLLQVPGAMDVGIEFHSWSKSYNMTGWRIGMVVGNAAAVHALMQVKSNIDSGIPQAIQEMAIAALEGPQDCIAEHNAIYQRRRDRLIEVLNHVGFKAHPPKASLYVWTRVPSGYTSVSLATELLEKLSVVVTPGVGYGDAGEGYIRLSLTLSDDDLEEGLKRLSGWQPSR